MFIVLVILIPLILYISTTNFYRYRVEGSTITTSTTSTLYTYTSTTDIGNQVNTETSAEEFKLRVIYVVLPLKNFTKLHNLVKANAILVAPCYVEEVFDLPRVIPRKFKPSLYPSLRAVLLEPDIGDGYLGEEDYIIINLPIPEKPSHNITTSRCEWHEYTYRMGFLYRYLVTLKPGLKIFTDRGIEVLNTSITIAIYYTYSKPIIGSGIPFDVQQTLSIGDAVGLERPSEPLAVKIEYNSIEEIESKSIEAWRKAEKASETWNNWLNELHKKLEELELDKYIAILNG
jgi:hypothetical protein